MFESKELKNKRKEAKQTHDLYFGNTLALRAMARMRNNR